MKDDDLKRCFLLGAGFTHAVTNGRSPLNDELMSKIKDLAISDFATEFNLANGKIEQFMTLVDLKELAAKDNHKRNKIKAYKAKIKEHIINIFRDEKLYDNSDNFCTDFCKKIKPNDCVLTLNYDCVLDRYLYLSKRWVPQGGYGLSSFPAGNTQNPENILLLKLHGSINFREHLKNTKCLFIEITPEIFPKINSHICPSKSIIDSGPHVMLMSYIKEPSPDLMHIWEIALEKLRKADQLTIIGCGLREEDTLLRFILNFCGKERQSKNLIVEIVDKDEESGKRLKEKLQYMIYDYSQSPKIYKNFKNYLENKS